LKICLVSEEYPPETGWGGIATYNYNIAHGLISLGHEVHVVSRSLTDNNVDYVDGEVKIHRIVPEKLPYPILRRLLYKYRWRLNQILEYRYGVWKAVKRLIDEHGIEVIEAPEWGGEMLFGLRRRKVPLVIRLHTPLFLVERLNKRPPQPGDGFIKWAEKRCVLASDQITAPSASLAEIVASEYSLPLEQIMVFPNPLDLEVFVPNPDAEALEPTVLYVGRLEKRKGVDILSQAIPPVLKACPKVKFIFAGADTNTAPGSGSFQEYLTNELQNAGYIEHVLFTGPLDRMALIKYYQQCQVCVVPSLYDNFPTTCLEAMACGKPVIASNSGGIPEIVQDNISGILVPPAESTILAEKIIQLLSDLNLRERLGNTARKWIEEHCSKERIARKTVDIYESILS